MIFFGHLGIGDALAAPVRGRLPRRWVLVGTVLPDLIDKPVYYGLAAALGRRAMERGLMRGTRGIGHTGALAAALWAAGHARGDDRGPALALGMATHLVLDAVADLAVWGPESAWRGAAAFWPLTGWSFPLLPYAGAAEHLRALAIPFLLACEVLGFLLLVRARVRALSAEGRDAGPTGPSST